MALPSTQTPQSSNGPGGRPRRGAAASRGGFRLGSVFGIEIRVSASWLFIAFLIGASLFGRFSLRFPDMAAGTALVLGSVFTLLFFASILLHEISHSVVANRRGLSVRGITLFLFGGVSETSKEATSPRDEFAVAIVGPLTSLGIAAASWAAVTFGGAAIPVALAYGIGYLGWANLALGAFNLVPGFPLDGGRVFRSIVWAVTGDRMRSTRIAGGAGRATGAVIIGLGALLVIGYGDLGGLWLVAVGWFLHKAASAAVGQTPISELLDDVTARELVAPDAATLPWATTLADAAGLIVRQNSTLSLVEQRGETIGVLTVESLNRAPRRDWDTLQAWWAMTPLDEVPTVAASDPASEVLEALAEGSAGIVAVHDDSGRLGFISDREISRKIRRGLQLRR